MNKERAPFNRKEKFIRRGAPAAVVLGGAAVLGAAELSESIQEANVCVPGSETITIQPGDSKWTIADRITEPSDDLRDTMVQLADVNEQLADPSYVLQSGDTLSIPVCGSEVSNE